MLGETGAGLFHFPFCWRLAPVSLGFTAAPGPGQQPRSLWSDLHLRPAVSSVNTALEIVTRWLLVGF